MHEYPGQTISLWRDTASAPDRPALKKNAEVDVCIIGGGISGLTTAYLLAKEGRQVMILEDGSIGEGETGRTTAHISNALDDRYFELEKLHGSEGIKLAARSHSKAITEIERIVTEEHIDCDFLRVSGYLFEAKGDKGDTLQKEIEAAHRAGLLDVELQKVSPLASYDIGPSLHFPRQGQFHSLKYLRGLTKAIEASGGIIHCHTHAETVEGGEHANVKTSEGQTVKAKHIVVATNVPMNDNATIYLRQAPYRSYVIGMHIPKGEVAYALYWDTADPYHYVRFQPDETDADSDVLIVGGEDHKTGEENDADDRYTRLEEWARKRFPRAKKVMYRWSGQIMETTDRLAMIGRKPLDEDNVYIITGDSGNGITHGTIGGMLIRDLIVGRENPWAALYDPSRKTVGSVKEFIIENLTVVKDLADWVKPGEKEEDVKRNEGAVIRQGTKKIALYIDEHGKKHALSAVCTHKGCIVHWNGGEKTWDCPCHGSRFDCKGLVLNGPSSKNLASVEEESR